MSRVKEAHANYDPPIYRTYCPVDCITGVWRFVRPPHYHSHRHSLPGHVLHLVVAGSYRLVADGRVYAVKKGHVIYYHGPEDIEWVGDDTQVTFISVGFLAPRIRPLPLDQRVLESTPAARQSFKRLFEASLLSSAEQRGFGIHAALLDILYHVGSLNLERESPASGHELWWSLEETLREKRMFRPSLDELAGLAGWSIATVVRTCRRATGLSPIQYLRKLRMKEARAILQFSDLNVSQVAAYLGYPRMHEFSREFTTWYGKPPSNVKHQEH